jgi:hypothetical protein
MTNKLHPLHSVSFVCSTIQCTGHYPGTRATGRSTVAALRFIADAIARSGTDSPEVRIIDHPGGGTPSHLLSIIKRLYAALFPDGTTQLKDVTYVGTTSQSVGTYIWIERK